MELGLSIAKKSSGEYDLAVIGGGPAGLTAAIYAQRRNLKTVVIEKSAFGGTMTTTSLIENYPGFISISGTGLAKKFESHAKANNAHLIIDEIVDVKRENEMFIMRGVGTEYKSKTLIIASGSKHRPLDVPGEKEFLGKGVSYCATCDAPFFKNKVIAVVGGGNSAVKDALYMAEICKKVYLIHRRDQFRADEADIQKLKGNEKVEFVLNSIVKKIEGDNTVKKIDIENVKNRESREIQLDGVFIDIGEIPNTDLFKELGVQTDKKGYIIVNRKMETNVPGLYAAGDITGGLAQIVNAAAEGAIAAISAYEFIKKPYWVKK